MRESVNTAAHSDLGFRSALPFQESVRRIVVWLEERGRIENSDKDPFDDQIIAVWERLSSARIAALARAGG